MEELAVEPPDAEPPLAPPLADEPVDFRVLPVVMFSVPLEPVEPLALPFDPPPVEFCAMVPPPPPPPLLLAVMLLQS
jgi:hypothetical protein